MSNDVARLIYDMAVKESYSALDLKNAYKRKCDELKETDVLKRLYNIVHTCITSKEGSESHSISLKKYNLPGVFFLDYKRYFISDEIQECDKKYTCTISGGISKLLVCDERTRKLIDDAIIQLDLRWGVLKLYDFRNYRTEDYEYCIWVSWEHWV